MAALVLLRLRRCRTRLFMVVLAVDERSEPIARVALDSFPDVEHRPAGRVDHDAADLTQNLEIADSDSERRQDDDVFCLDTAEVDATAGHTTASRFPLPAPRLPASPALKTRSPSPGVSNSRADYG